MTGSFRRGSTILVGLVALGLAIGIGSDMEAGSAASVSGGLAFTAETPALPGADAWSSPSGVRLILRLKITNRSNAAIRLSTYRSVHPELIDAAGEVAPFEHGANRYRPAEASDYPLLPPGQSVSIALDAVVRLNDRELDWRGGDGEHGLWHVQPSNAPYRLRLRYRQTQAAATSDVSSGKLSTGDAATGSFALPLKLAN